MHFPSPSLHQAALKGGCLREGNSNSIPVPGSPPSCPLFHGTCKCKYLGSEFDLGRPKWQSPPLHPLRLISASPDMSSLLLCHLVSHLAVHLGLASFWIQRTWNLKSISNSTCSSMLLTNYSLYQPDISTFRTIFK